MWGEMAPGLRSEMPGNMTMMCGEMEWEMPHEMAWEKNEAYVVLIMRLLALMPLHLRNHTHHQ